jgi:hypothetical protein
MSATPVPMFHVVIDQKADELATDEGWYVARGLIKIDEHEPVGSES